jgi:hypothetical protein
MSLQLPGPLATPDAARTLDKIRQTVQSVLEDTLHFIVQYRDEVWNFAGMEGRMFVTPYISCVCGGAAVLLRIMA